METDRGVITLFEGLVPRQHFYSSAKDSRTHTVNPSAQVRGRRKLRGGEREREETGREPDIPLDDWSRGESVRKKKMVDRGINNTKLPRLKDAGINRLCVAACIEIKSQQSCQQSYNLKRPDDVCCRTEPLAHPSLLEN